VFIVKHFSLFFLLLFVIVRAKSLSLVQNIFIVLRKFISVHSMKFMYRESLLKYSAIKKYVNK
jgi:hypothetical protein